MLSKIIKIKNVGLFENACPNGAIELNTVTTIYAENGRGKSTFAAILRACANSESERVDSRSTIDRPEKPEIEFLLDVNKNSRYVGSSWSGTPPTVFLFDAEFVETNVYSGFSVRPEQRQEFLEFALGETAVQGKHKADALTELISQQQAIIREQGNLLEAVSGGLKADQYVKLIPTEESVANAEIKDLRERIAAAKNANQIKQRLDPQTLQLLKPEFEPVFSILMRKLADIAADAESSVKAHLGSHNHHPRFENWISEGQDYLSTDLCPFCGQSLDGNDLMAKYQGYFNEGYQSLKAQVANLTRDIDSLISATFVGSVNSQLQVNEARIVAWNEEIPLEIPSFDGQALEMSIRDIRQNLHDWASRKALNPIEAACDQDGQQSVMTKLGQANAVLEEYNSRIRLIAKRFADYKISVAGQDTDQLNAKLRETELRKSLSGPQVATARAAYIAAQKEKERLENEKVTVRNAGDQTIKTDLQDYEGRVNKILTELGADFSISKLSQDYRGGSGAPRAGYGIRLRNKPVSLNRSPEFTSGHNFATTLSEADKRTLALAVFVARLDSEADLASKIVVLDDPVSSMDRNRRHQTVNLVAKLADQCKQLVVLSHDAYFLRTFKDEINRSTQSTTKTLQIRRVQNGYSAFANCDLDEICASSYYRHFRMLEDFVDGTTSADQRDVAKAIRPLLEGFLHRRYPGHIVRNQMLGRIINGQIKPATQGPFVHLQKSIPELEGINEYARQFQHDENPDSESVIVTDAELLHFAKRTLDFIYGAP